MVGHRRAPLAGLSLSLVAVAGLSSPATARSADNERWAAPVELYGAQVSASDPSTWAPELPAIPTPKIDVEPLAEAVGEATQDLGERAERAFGAAKRVVDRRSGAIPAHMKIGRPYQVDGVWYVPGVEEDYRERGIASWYGSAFHGKPTANGEIFDKHALTAAHPTLPLPSRVRVTNEETGQSIEVRVNDRGPFVDERVIDLSEAAAKALGFKADGVARVEVVYLGPAEPAKALGAVAASVGDWAASASDVVSTASAKLAPVGATVSAAAASAGQSIAQASPALVAGASSAAAGLTALHAKADWARQAQTAPRLEPAAASASQPEATIVAVAASNARPASADPFKVPEPLSAPQGSFAASGAAASQPRDRATAGARGLTADDVLHPDGRAKYAVALSKPRVAPSGAFVQVGAFADPDRAEMLAQRLGGPVRVQPAYVNGKTFHRVLIGPWPGDAEAQSARQVVADMGFADARVIRQD